MKKYFKLYSVIMVLLICLITSCAKEDNLFTNDGNGGANGIVELGDLPPTRAAGATTINYSTVTKSFPAQDEVDLPVIINYTGVNGAPEDVTLTIGFNNAVVTATNSTYTILPASLYTVPSFRVTIPKGQKTGTFIIKLKTSQFNFALTYALGISILSSSTGIISGNYSTGVFVVGAKNAYDGIYAIQTGSNVQRYSAPGIPTTGDLLNGPLAGNLTISTIDLNTVEITGLRWGSGSASGISGIDNLRATINPITNVVTMTALGNVTLANKPGLINTYDPATKTFTLNFDWNQTGAARVISLIMRYSGSR